MPVYYGASYYPEQWPATTWEHDIRLMKEAGLNATRIGEFAWTRMEPSEGNFDWPWLDRLMELFHANGVGVVLCTPTASPPMWVVDACPGMLPVDVNRTRRPAGGRRHYCPINADYRRHCDRVTEALAQRYGEHPALIGWQTDNEFGLENTGRCYCDNCAAAFRQWLQARYSSLAELNERWGTVFWSGEYNSWEQIQPPMQAINPDAPPIYPHMRHNPGWILDYERFQSDTYVSFQDVQIDALRKHSSCPITHNGTGFGFNKVDYYDLFKRLDTGGLDCYPSVVTENYTGASRNLSHTRCLTGKPPWILELSSGGGFSTWSGNGVVSQPAPGALRLVAWQVFANGGEMALYFQWRIMAKGAEQLESSILDMDGTPRRKYFELKRTAAELARLEPILSSTSVKSDVAVVWCYDHHWALSLKRFSNTMTYSSMGASLYDTLIYKGVNVDIVALQADLSKYKVVFLPSPILMTEEIAGALRSMLQPVEFLVSMFLSAAKDWENVGIWQTPLPGHLHDLFGVKVTEVDPGWEGFPTRVAMDLAGVESEYQHSVWSEILEVASPETTILGRIQGGYRMGEPVITCNPYGLGRAYYIGTWLEGKAMSAVIDLALADGGVIASPMEPPKGVEQVVRSGEDGDVTFLLNWTYAAVTVNLDGAYTDLIVDKRHEGAVEIPGRDLVVLVREWEA